MSARRWIIVAGLAISGAACGGLDLAGGDGGADPDQVDAGGRRDGDGGANDSDAGGTPAACPAELPPPRCPSGTPTIGNVNGFGRDRIPIRWRYCAESDTSWAPYVYGRVPDDMTSLAVIVDHGRTPTGIAHLESGGRTYLDNDWGEAPFAHYPLPAASVVLPIDANTDPEPGCLAVLPIAVGNVAGQQGTVWITSRRGPVASGLIDLNLVIASNADIYDDEIDGALRVMSSILGAASAGRVGAVDLWEIGVDYVHAEGADIDELRTTDVGGDPRRVNIFLVIDFIDEPLAGIAGGIPGPIGVHGTASSGVVVATEAHRLSSGDIDTQALGETFAHEVGHQLGLFHTTESDGLYHDYLADTPECPAQYDTDHDGFVTAEECSGRGASYLMFWTPPLFGSQQRVSPMQAGVLSITPIAR